MIKNKYVAFGLFVALFLVLWHLLDFLFNTFITGKGYQFSPIAGRTKYSGQERTPLAMPSLISC